MPVFAMTYPAIVLSPDALQDEATGTLTLNRPTEIAVAFPKEGKSLVIFTDEHAAEMYQQAKHPDYRAVKLGIAEFLCLLSRMGLYCQHILIDPNPHTGLSRIEPLEPIRQQLSAQLQEAANKAGL